MNKARFNGPNVLPIFREIKPKKDASIHTSSHVPIAITSPPARHRTKRLKKTSPAHLKQKKLVGELTEEKKKSTQKGQGLLKRKCLIY